MQREDSERAIALDAKYFKAYLRHGEASIEIGKLPKHQSTELIDLGIQSL